MQLRLSEDEQLCFAFGSSRAPASPSPADLRATIKSSHSGPIDGASYDIPNFPVLELARSLAARCHTSTQRPRPILIPARPPALTRTSDAPARVENFLFKKSGIGADAIRAAGSKRRLALKGGRGPAPISGRGVR